ncbi:unnamed protein product [Phaedon cochleariae]|uniref:Mitochondrial inner membrane protein Mpv17 n=1 Tax=Phaedon cochleariae TaxID=80249 RepID=A0A9P0DTT3_PHACE|nr:unnamed protein product [Phaedon cochleariae]
MSTFMVIYKGYQRLLTNHPMLVQSCQASVLMGTGDLIAQTVVEKKSIAEVDFGRTARFSTLGLVLVGPTLTTWYKCLEKLYGTSKKYRVIKKVATDQLCFVPCFHAVFITSINVLNGHDWAFTKEQLRLKYVDVVTSNYALWPAVQLVNFRFVPLSYQVLVVQCVAVFWNVYLSWKTQFGVEKKL